MPTTNIFTAEGCNVYGSIASGRRVLIATATESETWAEVIADSLNANPDAYVV